VSVVGYVIAGMASGFVAYWIGWFAGRRALEREVTPIVSDTLERLRRHQTPGRVN
jgi:membrane protein DedA with SNARE-associated domain